uniref:Bromo domain-containing protein n=3 Tax=Meloidogyne TaxID=189290 RepID=A0A914LDF9_MELIC
MLTLADKDNRVISPPFRVLPTPQEFPLYYEHIKKPIDIRKISENIRAGKYQTWEALKDDVQLMCKNARDFNEPGSTVHKDANTLLRHFKHRSVELAEARRFSPRVISRNAEIIDELLNSIESEVNDFSEDSEEDEDSERSDDPRWRLYWAIRNYDVVDGNFIELPCKRSYPDYYEEIERPLSLYMINKLLKRSHYANLDALVKDLLLMFDNAMNYNIEESGIYQAAVRFRHLTLKAAKALSVSDRSNGNFMSCNTDSDEINKFSSSSKKEDRVHNGFASTESKVIRSHSDIEPHQQDQSDNQTGQQSDPKIFSCTASTSSSVQQHNFLNSTNHSILVSNSQQIGTNVPSAVVSSQKYFSQGSSSLPKSPITQSHLFTSTTAGKNMMENGFQNSQRKQRAYSPSTSFPKQSASNSLNQQNLADTGRMFVSTTPKQMPIEPMFVSPSTSIHVRRVVHSEAYIRYLESMHNSGSGRQQRNISKWDKTLLASAKNTVVPEHKRLPYEWIRSSNNSKHKEDEVVRALWKLRDHIIEDTTGIARSQGIPNQTDSDPPPLVPTVRKGRPPKNANAANKNT